MPSNDPNTLHAEGFTPDGKHIVGVRSTGELALWDAASGKKVSRKALRSSK
jgi:hypothetical protein